MRRPKLVRDGCDVAEAIACADPGKNSIALSGLWNTEPAAMRRTVMLHELAHFLGVPHISGDKLMQPIALEEVDEPTPAAVALAKLGRKK